MKLHICDDYVMELKDIIAYGSFVQEAMGEYCNIVTSKQWEPTDINKLMMTLCI